MRKRKKLKLVTVHVPETANPTLAKNYRRAIEFNRGTLGCADFEVLALEHDVAGGKLKRDSAVEVGGERHLPFLDEVLDLARGSGAEWYGYINSDILLTHKFCPTFTRLSDKFDLISLRVRDIKKGTTEQINDERYHSKRRNRSSLDGVMIRRESGIELPGFVIGEPFWDSYLWHIMRYDHTNSSVELPTACSLHVAHPSRGVEGLSWTGTVEMWEGLSPGGDHNRTIHLNYRKELRRRLEKQRG